ncbi:MAG: thioredoxin fold domain-containing protein [bacterium]
MQRRTVKIAVGLLVGMLLALGQSTCKRELGGSFGGKPKKRKSLRDAAAARAAAKVGRVLLYTAKWCPHCHQLKHEVWEKPSGEALLGGIALETVDFDAPANQPRVIKHAITGLPTTVFLKPDGTELDRIEGFEGAKAFLEEAQAILQGRDGLQVLQDRFSREPKNVGLLYKIGRKLLNRGLEKRAFATHDKVLALDPTDKSDVGAKIAMHRARYLVRVKRDYKNAAALLQSAVIKYPAKRVQSGLRYWLGHALCKDGRRAEAVKMIDAYVRERGSTPKALILAAELRHKCRHQLPGALALARRVVRAEPKNDWGWYLVADLSFELGQRKAARQAIERAVQLNAKSAFYKNERKRITAREK